MNWVCRTCEERRGAYRVLVGNPEGRRPFEVTRCRWEYNVNIDPQEVGRGMVWIDMAEGRDRWRALANAVMNLRVLFHKMRGIS
jgi:hypothetical protein